MEASKMTDARKRDSDIARYFQEHRDDEGEWSSEAEPATIKKTGSVVYSVRFKTGELSELRLVATSRGLTLSELIRSSAIRHVRETDVSPIEVAAPKADKLVYQGHGQGPRRSGTQGQKPESLVIARMTQPATT
jgi:hypothetical protein